MAQESEEWSAERSSVRDLLEEFFRRYLTQRDPEGTLALVDDSIISIGSGEGEVALDKTAFRQLLEEEFAVLEQPIRFSLSDFIQRQRAEDVWVCFCNLATIVTLPDGQQVGYPMRVTAAVCRRPDGLRIQMIHASEASLFLEDGELIPLKFLSRGVESLSRETRLDLLEIIGQIMPGGILGGISSGQTILLRAAVKPISSIAREQSTVDIHGAPVTIRVGGRHDLSAIPRCVPVHRAMAALVLADMLLLQRRLGRS